MSKPRARRDYPYTELDRPLPPMQPADWAILIALNIILFVVAIVAVAHAY